MTNNLTAVQGFSGDAGATVWWTLRGEVDRTALVEAWRAQGLPDQWLPDLPSAERRLSRAVQSVSEMRRLARPVQRKGHWIVVAEKVTGEGAGASVAHEPVLSVRLEGGQPVYTVQGTGYWEVGAAYALEDQIRAEWARQDGLLTRDDVALWLADVIQYVHGVPLRPKGGLYYVLPSQVERWRLVCQCIEGLGIGSSYTLPTLRGQDATRAVLDALVADVTRDADDYHGQIMGGALKGRALQARVRDCDNLLSRVAQYDSLLGGALDTLRQRVLAVQDAALLAACQIEGEALAADEAADD